jgi:hypothetical protein
LQKSLCVIPSKAKLHVHKDGIQYFQDLLDPGFRRGDLNKLVLQLALNCLRISEVDREYRKTVFLCQENKWRCVRQRSNSKSLMDILSTQRKYIPDELHTSFPVNMVQKCIVSIPAILESDNVFNNRGIISL